MAPNPCDECPHHENVEFRLTNHTSRLDAHAGKLDTLDSCLVRLTAIEEQNAKTLASMRADVDEIKQKPAKQWSTAQNVALTVLVTAVINALLQSWNYI